MHQMSSVRDAYTDVEISAAVFMSDFIAQKTCRLISFDGSVVATAERVQRTPTLYLTVQSWDLS